MKLEDLKVGQYVRTKDGYISQYKYYDYNIGEGLIGKLLCIPLSNGTFANIKDIVKADYKIIKILEKGDYVNGHRVEEIDFENEEIFTDSEYYCGIVEFCNIKSVITHEQMEQMSYKVGD